jgi:hypothetical protein
MINLKFITNYALSKDISEHYKLYLNNGEWDGITIDGSKPVDIYIIINYPNNYDNFESKKTIVFQNEPSSTRNSWGYWRNPPRKDFLYVYDINKHKSITGWGLKLNYNQLTNLNIEKTQILSTITSDLYLMPGHKLRLHFLNYIDNKIHIDIFGALKSNSNGTKILRNLKQYKYSLKNKESGLLTYKYCFMSENSSEKNYFTEKLVDCILSETLCFYYGCSNIEDFIDDRAYIKIDITKPSDALQIMKNAIENNEWEKRIQYIKEAKYKILNFWQMMPTIKRLLVHKKYM